MQTITLRQPGQFQLSETDPPTKPRPSEALVRVHRVGVCGTDIHAYGGRQPFFTYPRILGHELGVEVLEIGANEAGVKPGDRCAVEPYINCGKCIACRNGKTNCCAELKVLGVHTDGGMREQIVVPAHKLHKSDTLSLEQLALVETLGIGAHAVDRACLQPADGVLVIGAGPIGLSVVQFATIVGAKVIVTDVSQSRLDFCRITFPVKAALPADQNLEENLASITSDLPTCVFDATGNPKSMEQAFQYVSPGGRLVFVGLVQSNITFSDPHFHRREMTLLATRNSTANDFKRIIALMESGKIDARSWITHRASCVDMLERFPVWIAPESETIKAMVEF
jgi:2-desacetyl-2-hydroxyethyl bacteriochlorophyllide A dehydrogenase